MTSKIVLILFSLVIFVSVSEGAQFSADLRMVQHGNALSGQFYARDSIYRIDMKTADRGIYVTVNEKTNSATVFNVPAKQYMVMPVTNPQIIKTDPIQTARMLESLGAIKNYQGTDTLDGWLCDAYIYLRESEPALEVWIARDLSFPIRVGNPRDTSTYMALVNIKTRSLDDSLFAVPAGFAEREKPQREAPPGSPAPRVVKEGTKLRLPLDPSRIAVISLISTAKGETDCRLTFFADGEALPESRTGGDELCSFHFAAQGDKADHAFDTRADEVLIEVSQGAVAVDINQ